jgi:CBS-domain-containing membrane protein
MLGFGFHTWLGPGYPGAALALVGVIAVMILTNTMHPPAVATALNFAFRAGTGEGNLLLFGLAVGLVLVLLAVQRGSAYLVRRFTPVS